MSKYYIQIRFWNPSSHEYDWCIIGENNEETYSEESARLFNSEEDARAWTETDEAKQWLPFSFEIHESVYKEER